MDMKPRQILQDFVDRGAGCHGAVVFGMECALWGVPARPAMRAFVYQALAGQIAAAFKLIPIGQMTAQRILCDLTADIECELDAAMRIPPEEAGWFSPLADIASAKHERAYSRLFIS
jgi:urease accessory protein